MAKPQENPALTSKTCTKCLKDKALNLFRRKAASKDGRRAYCKECQSEKDKKYRLRPENIARKKEYMAAYNKTPKYKAYQKAYLKSEKGKDVIRRSSQKYALKNPIKRSVKSKVLCAIRTGKITKPHHCEWCNSCNRLDGHHSDYLKPFDVLWLCRKCHKSWHRENGPGLNGGDASHQGAE
jgi:hypothetical protein